MTGTAADVVREDTGNVLPEWSLSDLYDSPHSPLIENDLNTAADRARSFAVTCQGKLAGLAGTELGAAIAEYERIEEIIGRIMSYAQLRYAADVSNEEAGRFLQTMQERVTGITTGLLFFTLELNRVEDDVLNGQLSSPQAARYEPWIRDVRLFRAYQLSEELEKLLHEKRVSGRAAWVRLFDETMAALRFEIGGQTLNLSEVLNRLSDRDRDVRRDAAKALGRTLQSNVRLFALVTNTLAKDKQIEDTWRKYPSPLTSRNLSNQVEDEVVEALVSAVQESYPRLSHRYYGLKAKWFGVEALDYWDRNAPLPDADERSFTWNQARDVVLGAYHAFSPDAAKVARRFFDGGWIDAVLRSGKQSGAFAHPTVPAVHPYILLNFHGKARDVMTLAHELGHGIHQCLAAQQGPLLSDTPLTLAETASVFGEMLTFRSLLDAEQDAKRRRSMLAAKVEDMLNTVVRQIAFHQFEWRVHSERREGELSSERLAEIWMEIQSQSLGPAIRFDDDYRVYWAYIPHFIHSPFYVYAYAFGDCLVNSLYAVFRDGHPDFQSKYLEMLRAGGTQRHKQLLAPFGLDATDPGFWHRGLAVVGGLIDELEALE